MRYKIQIKKTLWKRDYKIPSNMKLIQIQKRIKYWNLQPSMGVYHIMFRELQDYESSETQKLTWKEYKPTYPYYL